MCVCVYVCVCVCVQSQADSCCGEMKRFLLVVPINRVSKHPPLISSDPEHGWQGCRQAKATGNNAVVHWCYKEECKMLMTTDRLCMHTHCNHIIIPTGQLVTLPSVGAAFSSPGVHIASYKHHNRTTHNNISDTSPVYMACCSLLQRLCTGWWSCSSDKGAIG